MKSLFACLLLLTACHQEEKREFADVILQIPLSITPEKDSVSIGDTLWLTADFSNQLQELNSGNSYRVTPSNFSIKTSIAFFKLTPPLKSLATQEGSVSHFVVTNKTGKTVITSQTFGNISYDYKQDKYLLKTGIIPKHKGIYTIYIGDGWLSKNTNEPGPDLSYIDAGITPNGVKRELIFRTIFYSINNGRTNFNILQQHILLASIAYPSTSNTNTEQRACFTFVVQ
ncbi:hypothetical protein [Hymenobacter sp. UYP22]|uniref:hypothetical protein n=1 Tax=Hymenobacter sp. UYP22 TaxID=3156348 RepID=UPI0033968A08